MSTSKTSRRLALMGMMGCGKSSVAQALSERLNLPFLDVDEEIVREAGQPIPFIFDHEGEAGFRRRETDVLERLAVSGQGGVVALGGGTPVLPQNARVLQEAFCPVWLDAPWDILFSRVEASDRPLLQAGATDFRDRYWRRRSVYESLACFTVDVRANSIDQVTERVANWWKEHRHE